MHEPSFRSLYVLALALAIGLALDMAPRAVLAHEAPAIAVDPEIEARMMVMATELRCLVCQNQSIADSHAGLAQDLRQQIREMLVRGMSERQIRAYMTDRYGDFVLYRPPFKASTMLLWLGPALLLLVALGTLLAVLHRRQHMGVDAFDPDTPDEEPDHAANR